MKTNSNLFKQTSSTMKIEIIKKEKQKEKASTKQTSFDLHSADKKLIKEVKNRGDKISEKDVVFITKDKDGKIRWLEKGKSKSESNKPSGLKHIIEEHKSNFNKKGVPTNLIPAVIKKAIEEGKIVGISGKDRDVYETIFNGKAIHLAITVSSNGYIVGAHPVSIWKEKK